MQQGGLSLPSHDTLEVWAKQSPFLERSLIQSAKRCCLQECLNNGMFCSRMFLLSTPLKYDHILYLISLLIYRIARCFPAKTNQVTVWLSSKIWLKVLKWTKYYLSLYHNFPSLIGSFMSVLHSVRIMPSYSTKTINRMHNKINTGNYWLHCDVTLFVLKLKCFVAQLHLGL